MDSAFSTVTNLASMVGKKVIDLSQSVHTYINPGAKKSIPLDERFLCPIHPPKLIKHFTFQHINNENLPYFFCEDCFKNLTGKDAGEKFHLFPITELPTYYISRYDTIRDCSLSHHVNKVSLDNYLQKEQQMRQQMAQLVENQKQELSVKINAVIELFTSQMNQLKEHIFSLFTTELDTFTQNLAFVKKNIEHFFECLKAFETLPTTHDIQKKVEELSSIDHLSTFTKENNTKLDAFTSLLPSLRSTLEQDVVSNLNPSNGTENEFNEYASRYKYALHLVRRIYETFREPPKNPKLSKLEYKAPGTDKSPHQFLLNLLNTHLEPSSIKATKLQNSVENLQKSIEFECFAKKCHKVEPFQVDTLDFFSPNTPEELQCLHYYNYDEKSLCLLNLPELNSIAKSQAKLKISTPLKISLPANLKIARYAKTIASSDGIIYFIGGENSADTVTFEYKSLLASQKSFKKNSAELNRSNSTHPTTFQISVNYKKKKTLESEEEIDMAAQGLFSVRAKMTQPRHGHSLVFAENDSIYAIGGIDATNEDGYLIKCERYSIKEDKWVSLADCIYGASYPGLCTFDNVYIYKFGGFVGNMGQILDKVERYNIMKNKWLEINVTASVPEEMVPLYPKTLPLQISDDELILVGGQTEVFLCSEKCSFLRVNRSTLEVVGSTVAQDIENPSESNNENLSQLTLPIDNRMPYQCVIYDGKLFCLVEKHTANGVIYNALMFDGTKWSLIF